MEGDQHEQKMQRLVAESSADDRRAEHHAIRETAAERDRRPLAGFELEEFSDREAEAEIDREGGRVIKHDEAELAEARQLVPRHGAVHIGGDRHMPDEAVQGRDDIAAEQFGSAENCAEGNDQKDREDQLKGSRHPA